MEFNIALLVIGIIFFIASFLILINDIKNRKNNTMSVMAEVSQYFTSISHDPDGVGDSIVYHPIMKYNVAGKWYEKPSSVGMGKQKYDIGERVEILYDPDQPDNFIIAGDNTTRIATVVGLLISIGIIILAFWN